jgi:hypothetical protein
MTKVTRRFLVTRVGAASSVPGTTLLAAAVNESSVGDTGEVLPSAANRPSAPVETTYFFNATEETFIEAACAGPENGCIAMVRGLRESHRRAISCHSPPPSSSTRLRAINRDFERLDTTLGALPAADQDAYLKSLEAGEQDLDGVPASVFVGMLLQMTVEGTIQPLAKLIP